MADEIKATVSLNQALGLDKEAPKKGFPGANGEVNKGKIVDEFRVNEKAPTPETAAPTAPKG